MGFGIYGLFSKESDRMFYDRASFSRCTIAFHQFFQREVVLRGHASQGLRYLLWKSNRIVTVSRKSVFETLSEMRLI